MKKILYQVFVEGTPTAQPRPRMMRNGHVYNPDTADAWKEEIKRAFTFVRKPAIEGAIYLEVAFYLPRPKSMPVKPGFDVPCVPHTKKPDTDNLLKAVMDALTLAGIWKDDAQVYRTDASKFYTNDGRVGAQIIISTKEE